MAKARISEPIATSLAANTPMLYGLIAHGQDIMGVKPENDHSNGPGDVTSEPYWLVRSTYQLNTAVVTPEENPDPLRYSIISLLPPAWPGVWVTLSNPGSVADAGVMTPIEEGGELPPLVNGDHVTLFWTDNMEYCPDYEERRGGTRLSPLPFCRMNMLWNGTSLVTEPGVTMGQDWTRPTSPLFSEGEMLAFVQEPVADILLMVRRPAKWMIGVPVFVSLEPLTKVIPVPKRLIAEHAIRRFAGKASIGDWKWAETAGERIPDV